MAAHRFMLQRRCRFRAFDKGVLFVLVSAELTFNLLFWASGMTGGAGHAHIVPVNVLEKHLGVPAGQRARLAHKETMRMRTNSQRFTATTNQESDLFKCACINFMKSL